MNNFFQRLNRELIRAEVWGSAARMLEQELRDHYLTEKAALLQGGKENGEAERLALAKLGDPVVLAKRARLELDRRDSCVTTQVLLRLVPLCLGPATFFVYIWGLRLALSGLGIGEEGAKTSILVVVLGPWLAAFFWVWHASHRPVHGWRYLLLLSGYLSVSYFISASWLLSDGGIAFDPARMAVLILFQSLLLLMTPWRIRARKMA